MIRNRNHGFRFGFFVVVLVDFSLLAVSMMKSFCNFARGRSFSFRKCDFGEFGELHVSIFQFFSSIILSLVLLLATCHFLRLIYFFFGLNILDLG